MSLGGEGSRLQGPSGASGSPTFAWTVSNIHVLIYYCLLTIIIIIMSAAIKNLLLLTL